MNIKLTPEQEQIVKEEIASGRFRSTEEVVGEALRALREKEQSSSRVASNGGQGEAVREMITFAETNSVRLNGVSIKELIREGRRL